MNTCRGQKLPVGVGLPQLLSTLFMEAGPLIGAQRPSAAGLATQLAPKSTVSSSQVLELQAAVMPAKHGLRDPNSGLHVCTARALPNEPSPSLQSFLKVRTMKGINV